MKYRFLKTSTYLVLLFLLLFTSCQKQIDTPFEEPASKENFVAEAKAWFANGPVLSEKKMLELPFTSLPENSPKRLFARMAKLQSKLKWDEAQFIKKDEVQYIVVPVIQNKKIFNSDYEIVRSFVFYKTKATGINMNVVEVVSAKGQTLNGKSAEITATAFYNKMTKKSETVSGANGTIFFYNDLYQSLDTYEIRNGVWKTAKVKLSIGNSAGRNMQGQMRTEVQNCETWYVVYSQYEDGILIYQEILSSYEVCTGGGPAGDETEETYGGSGDGGGGYDPNVLENAIADFKFNYEINAVSENLGSELQSETATTREKKYPWICGRALLVQAKSLEYGTHKKVNNEWQWESLTHQSVTLTGVVIGGSVSVSSNSGQATLGIYNAIMSVDYTLHYNAIIPGFSPVNWHASKSASSAWHVDY